MERKGKGKNSYFVKRISQAIYLVSPISLSDGSRTTFEE
jgi:hypothetical protein